MLALEPRLVNRHALLRQAILLEISGDYALEQGAYGSAEKLLARCSDLSCTLLGAEHAETFRAVLNLSAAYLSCERWKEAEELLVKLLAIKNQLFHEDHPYSLTAKTYLAMTYQRRGLFKEAEELDIEVLERSARILGEGHPRTLIAMSTLAATYYRQGRRKEADELLSILEARRSIYGQQGRGEEEKLMQIKVLGKLNEVLSDEHPDTIRAMDDLAATLNNIDQHVAALDPMRETVMLSRKTLGDEHPYTITRHNLLASWMYKHSIRLHALGQTDAAVTMMTESATLGSKLWGDEDFRTVEAQKLLGYWAFEDDQRNALNIPADDEDGLSEGLNAVEGAANDRSAD